MTTLPSSYVSPSLPLAAAAVVGARVGQRREIARPFPDARQDLSPHRESADLAADPSVERELGGGVDEAWGGGGKAVG